MSSKSKVSDGIPVGFAFFSEISQILAAAGKVFPYATGTTAVDKPGQGIGETPPTHASVIATSAKDSYTMYLMYKPPGENSIPVPIQYDSWF